MDSFVKCTKPTTSNFNFDEKNDFLAPMPLMNSSLDNFKMPEPKKVQIEQLPIKQKQHENKFVNGFGSAPLVDLNSRVLQDIKIKTKILTLPVPKDYSLAKLD